jgi:hypothetical protein
VLPIARTNGFPKGSTPAAPMACRGAVLLEVVLALVLFVAAATVITSSLNTSMREVERLRLSTHANNLAVSILAEMQMGLKGVESSGPTSFEAPFDNWSWESKAAPVDDRSLEGNQLQNIEIVVRHRSEPVVRRIVQFLPVSAGQSLETTNATASFGAREERTGHVGL